MRAPVQDRPTGRASSSRVELRDVTGAQDRHGRRWSQHRRIAGIRTTQPLAIPARCGVPTCEAVVDDDRRRAVDDHESRVRDVPPGQPPRGATPPPDRPTFTVQHPIHVRRPRLRFARRLRPQPLIIKEVRTATLGARAVSRCQRNSLIQEEERRIGMWLPLRRPPILERQPARDPQHRLVLAHHDSRARSFVETTSIAHPRTANRRRDDVTPRSDSVLCRHGFHECHPTGLIVLVAIPKRIPVFGQGVIVTSQRGYSDRSRR